MKTTTQILLTMFFCWLISTGLASAQKMVALDIGSYDGYGTVKQKSGEILNDTLYFSFAADGKLRLAKKNPNDPLEMPRKYTPSDVEYFTIADTTFVPVKTPSTLAGAGEFMIQLTPEGYKIQLFKKYEQSEDKTRILHKFYAMFPNQKNARDIVNDLSLIPFSKKVPKLITDCPDLTEKIGKKEDLYKIPMISNEKTCYSVYRQVADNYQTCN